MDTYASEGTCVPAGGLGIVSTGISLQMPADVYARIAPRSGLAVKNKIAVGGGVIDPDYPDRIARLVLERELLLDADQSCLRSDGKPIGAPLASEALVLLPLQR